MLKNSSSFNDSIFTSQPDLSVESGTQPSLHPNSHHQVIYAKFNLEVLYPPSYAREVWHYQDSNADLIRSTNADLIRSTMLILSDPLMNLTGLGLLRINM